MSAEPSPDARSLSFTARLIIGAVASCILFSIYFFNRDSLSLQNLADQQQAVVAFQHHHPWLMFVVAYLLYTAGTGLSLPGAAVMTLLYGWFLQQAYPGITGLLSGILLVSFASTSGASVAFLSSRFLFQAAVRRRFGDRLEKFQAALAREGAFYLFTLRLIPAVPFFIINIVMGLTPIRVRTFWWVSQVGMLPGTCLFVYAGSTLPGPQEILDGGAGGILTPQLVAAFILLGLFPLLVKWGFAAVRARQAR